MPNDDEKIWQVYTKGVKRIRKNSKEKKVENMVVKQSNGPPLPLRDGDTKGDPSHVKTKGLPSNKPRFLQPLRQAERNYPAFDRATERKLREGAITIDARIDLHGMTQAEAHAALVKFIAVQVKASRRNLLIITGKGKGNEGVLRMNLAGWVEALPEAKHILAVRPAALRHGGAGAFYVILKRRKDKHAE